MDAVRLDSRLAAITRFRSRAAYVSGLNRTQNKHTRIAIGSVDPGVHDQPPYCALCPEGIALEQVIRRSYMGTLTL